MSTGSAKARILITDNNVDLLNTTADILEDNNFIAIKASSYLNAINTIKQGDVDLALVDIRLVNDLDENDKSGLTLVKNIYKDVPVIVYSSHPTPQETSEIMTADTDGKSPAFTVISKDASTDTLIKMIDRALSSQSKHGYKIFFVQYGPFIPFIMLVIVLFVSLIGFTTGNPIWLSLSFVFSILSIIIKALSINYTKA